MIFEWCCSSASVNHFGNREPRFTHTWRTATNNNLSTKHQAKYIARSLLKTTKLCNEWQLMIGFFRSLTLGSYANVQPDAGLIDGWSAKTFLIWASESSDLEQIWNASWIFREVFESRIGDRSLGNDLWGQPVDWCYQQPVVCRREACWLPIMLSIMAFRGDFFLLSFFGNWVQLGCRSSRHMRVEQTPAGDSNNFVSGLLQCSAVGRSCDFFKDCIETTLSIIGILFREIKIILN